jgi:hypothetical protein
MVLLYSAFVSRSTSCQDPPRRSGLVHHITFPEKSWQGLRATKPHSNLISETLVTIRRLLQGFAYHSSIRVTIPKAELVSSYVHFSFKPHGGCQARWSIIFVQWKTGKEGLDDRDPVRRHLMISAQ